MLQQQNYHGGNGTPSGLAQYLVQQFEQTRRLRAQVIGQGESLMVQIAREGREDRAPTLTVAIARNPNAPQDTLVTMGEQQWVNSANEHAVFGSMVGALFTPWALFGLLGPLRNSMHGQDLNDEVWNMVNTFMVGQGAVMTANASIDHPYSQPAQ